MTYIAANHQGFARSVGSADAIATAVVSGIARSPNGGSFVDRSAFSALVMDASRHPCGLGLAIWWGGAKDHPLAEHNPAQQGPERYIRTRAAEAMLAHAYLVNGSVASGVGYQPFLFLYFGRADHEYVGGKGPVAAGVIPYGLAIAINGDVHAPWFQHN